MTSGERTFPSEPAPQPTNASIDAATPVLDPVAPAEADAPVDAEPAAIGAHAAPAPAPAPLHAAHGTPAAEPEPAFVPAAAAEEPEPVPAHPAPAAEPAHAAPAAEPAAMPAPAPEPGPEQDGEPARPDTTAEIDVAAVERKLTDPGSTQSFPAVTEERIDTDSTYDAGTSTALMWGARSDVGCVRTHNEDSYLVQSPLFCVCDGMGGHAAGEVASSLAVETIARLAPHEADPARLAAAVEAANAAIIEAADNGLGKPGMGCTATVAYIEGTSLAIAHVGDSRAYLLHEGTLIRVTHDHSYVEELVDAGEITADEARVHPNRSVITRALGSDPAMYADHFQLNIEEGDRLILCSDGLSSMVPDADIEAIAMQSPTAQLCVDNLVDAALAAGGGDNVTVVVADVVDDGRMRDLIRRRRRNIFIALAGVVFALAAALAVGAYIVTNSLFLGVHNGHVAIYTGVPESILGIDLYRLYDETAIQIDDLPEDTQNRLNEGIGQASMDAARATLSQYRTQIDADRTKAAQNAAAIEGSSTKTDDAAGAQAPDASADAAETPGGDA